jgi:hypothetical protein
LLQAGSCQHHLLHHRHLCLHWDCTGETEDTVDNIIDQDPELVLALGDFSYSGDADCWFDIIEPIADKTKITMGNHEDADDYMDFFGLKEQYYSFNYKNVHILALSTEIDYDDDSEQYQFAIKDLEKYSKDHLLIGLLFFIIDICMALDLLSRIQILENYIIHFLTNTK